MPFPRNSLLLKAGAIVILAVLLLIPLGMIEGLIAERAGRRLEAVASVQASFAGPQAVALPFFVWPYVEQWTERSVDANNRVHVTQLSESKQLVWFASETSALTSATVNNDRYRGIHRVRTFEAAITIDGTVTWPDRSQTKPAADRHIVWGEPRLVLPISDVRGLRGAPSVALNGEAIAFREGTQLSTLPAGLHATVTPTAAATTRFRIVVELAGTERLAFSPTAAASTVTINSAWPDPHFGGRYLPRERTVSASGFSATWSVSALASDVQQQIRELASSGRSEKGERSSRSSARLDTFDVDFIEAVNPYLLADRSTKHGVLIIVMVFGTLFMLDTMRSLNAHTIQYGFVGLALVIFFLLLVSLSEHVAFGLAYLIAATACTVLITYYVGHVLADRGRALGFGVALALMYSAIYGILISEGTALLMGSALLFALLATAMIATRRFDWRKLQRTSPTHA